MDKENTQHHPSERRSEIREIAQRYYSVQFTAQGLDTHYQFKLWNISEKGLCILVKENSEVLNYLVVGDTLEMIFYLTDAKGENEKLNTEIIHITQNENGRFQGHVLVGLAIIRS